MHTGLLNEDDNGRTDLGTLEKRLADKRDSQRASQGPGSHPTSPSQQGSVVDANGSTPRSEVVGSPETTPAVVKKDKEKDKDKRKPSSPEPEKSEEAVEALSDMMCSLVTNNCGETRYIGMNLWGYPRPLY